MAEKKEKPAHAEAGNVIAHDNCPHCGLGIDIKINRNGRAYWRCTGRSTHSAGEWGGCSAETRFPFRATDAMLQAFLAADRTPVDQRKGVNKSAENPRIRKQGELVDENESTKQEGGRSYGFY
jgi:hypothetical protein